LFELINRNYEFYMRAGTEQWASDNVQPIFRLVGRISNGTNSRLIVP